MGLPIYVYYLYWIPTDVWGGSEGNFFNKMVRNALISKLKLFEYDGRNWKDLLEYNNCLNS